MALGRILREARERRQLTLSQVAAATRMKVQVAQALEAEDFRKIPAPIYGRGFIRMYAEFIGVDPKPLVAEYMAAVSGPVDQPAVAAQAPVRKAPPAVAPVTQAPAGRPAIVKIVPIDREPEPPRPEPPAATPPVSAPPPPTVPAPIAAPPPSAPVAEPAPSSEPRQGDDLFSWGQTAAVSPKGPAEEPPPPAPPEPPPQAAPATETTSLPADAPLAPPAPAAVESPAPDIPAEPKREPEPPAPAEPEPLTPPAPASQQKAGDDLFSAAAPLARPPKATLGPQPSAYLRRGPQRPAPGEEPKLYREREALRTRTILVLIGIVIVAIFLISALSKCSTPPQKEVKRGPVKEQLKLAVEPPAPYVD